MRINEFILKKCLEQCLVLDKDAGKHSIILAAIVSSSSSSKSIL